MILDVILIAGGLLFIIATGVFLFELGRAPLAVEDENGFRLLKNPGAVRHGEFKSGGAGTYANRVADAHLSAL